MENINILFITTNSLIETLIHCSQFNYSLLKTHLDVKGINSLFNYLHSRVVIYV